MVKYKYKVTLNKNTFKNSKFININALVKIIIAGNYV